MRFRTLALALALSCGVTGALQAAKKPVYKQQKVKKSKKFKQKAVKVKPYKTKKVKRPTHNPVCDKAPPRPGCRAWQVASNQPVEFHRRHRIRLLK